MGPYCRFCDHRCFTRMPTETPAHIVQAYVRRVGALPIIATCPQGQAHERETVGYCYDDIQVAILQPGKEVNHG